MVVLEWENTVFVHLVGEKTEKKEGTKMSVRVD